MVLLAVRELSRDFAGVRALRDVSLDVGESEVVGLIGPNGAGKTTLLTIVAGDLPPSRGRVEFRGKVLTGLSASAVAKCGVVRTYQRTSLFAKLTVLENVRIGAHLSTDIGIATAIFRRKATQREEQAVLEHALETLEFVGLRDRLDVVAEHLPYGDQRRLGVAIALAARPALLMLDEPAAGMNPEEAGALLRLIRAIRKRGISVLLIDHNMRLIMQLCDRVVVLDHGERIAEGTPPEVSQDPRVIRVYLGDAEEHGGAAH